MRKTASAAASAVIKIARAGEATREITFVEGKTVGYYLSGITLGSSETIYVESEVASMDDIIERGDMIQLVGKKDGGADDEEPSNDDEDTDEQFVDRRG